MTKEYIINNPIDILILAYREEMKNAMADSFQKLYAGDEKGYREKNRDISNCQSAIKALEQAKDIMKGI